MFAVDNTTAETIRRAFEDDGELAAMIEFRRHFPLIQDGTHACSCVRMIASWQPIPLQATARPPANET